MSKALDLTGQKFERLTAIEPIEKREGGNIVWRCVCDCGSETFVSTGNLGVGHTRSCGCLSREVHTTHGMGKIAVYKIWQQMIQRCENPNYIGYKYYGGHGGLPCPRD